MQHVARLLCLSCLCLAACGPAAKPDPISSAPNEVGQKAPPSGGMPEQSAPPGQKSVLAGLDDNSSKLELRLAHTVVAGTVQDANGHRHASAPAVVKPGRVASLTMRGAPAYVQPGAPFTVTVTAYDAYHNVDTAFLGSVAFTTSDINANMPDTYQFTAQDNGVHTFTVPYLSTAFAQNITATVVGTGVSTSQSVFVETATGLLIDAPAQATPGAPVGIMVSASGNDPNHLAPLYTGTVRLTSSDPSATLPAPYTFNRGDMGQHVFPVTFATAGTQTLTVSDTGDTALVATSAPVNVWAEANHFVVSGIPSAATAGAIYSVVVQAVDANNAPVSLYDGSVEFSSSDLSATLPGPYTFNTNDMGVHTFTNAVVLRTAGSQSVSVYDVNDPNIAAVQSNITVVNDTPVDAMAVGFAVSGVPTTVTMGVPASITVSPIDANGQVVQSYQGTITFSSTDGNALLPAPFTFGDPNAGTQQFLDGVTFGSIGTFSITVQDGNGLTGSETSIQVTDAPAATALAFSGIQTTESISTPITFTLTALDGNAVFTAYNGTVVFSSSDSNAVFSPLSYTFNGNDAGVHTFTNGLTFYARGAQSVMAYDAQNPNVVGRQDTINVTSFLAMSGHARHACAVRADKYASCWGDNEHGQLGRKNVAQRMERAGPRNALLPQVDTVVAAENHSCALLTDGRVACWGDNAYGQLGVPPAQRAAPGTMVRVNLGEERKAEVLAATSYHTCALLDNAEVTCWGINDVGQLGPEGEAPNTVPFTTKAPIVDVAAGRYESCALDAEGAVFCWGDGRPTPARVPLDEAAIQLSAGASHTCALLTSSKVSCWRPEVGAPLVTSTVDVPVTGVAAGDEETCLVLDKHHISCTVNESEPHTRGVIFDLMLRKDSVCALLDSGAIACWELTAVP